MWCDRTSPATSKPANHKTSNLAKAIAFTPRPCPNPQIISKMNDLITGMATIPARKGHLLIFYCFRSLKPAFSRCNRTPFDSKCRSLKLLQNRYSRANVPIWLESLPYPSYSLNLQCAPMATVTPSTLISVRDL
jgi:hypothetical protein